MAVNILTQLIQSSAWSSSIKCHPSTHLPQIPEYTRSIIVEKRRSRALYQRTRLPSHKQKYNKLANHLKKLFAKQKSESLANFLSNLSSKDYHLPSISTNSIIPNSQFGFRCAHSTIQQVHRVVDAISYSLKKKLYCTIVFLDVSQAFDRSGMTAYFLN